MTPNENLISGIKRGLEALREAHVEPMGLSITAHDGTFGWGFYKYKALPGHPNPGNAGSGWSHPSPDNLKPGDYSKALCPEAHAPRNWPQEGSFPWDWQTTLAEVKAFALEIGRRTGYGTDFELECAWRNTDRDMTVPGTVGTLSDMHLLRGGAEDYAYYPDSRDEISYVDKDGKPVDEVKEERVRTKFRGLKAKERAGTDAYMQPPKKDNPVTVAGAWYVDSLPGGIVAELDDGALVSFSLSPFRAVGAADFTPYDGQHPRKQHGNPVPSALYAYYGLSKSEESLTEVLRVRLSPSELEKLKATADGSGKTVSEFAREWVRGL